MTIPVEPRMGEIRATKRRLGTWPGPMRHPLAISLAVLLVLLALWWNVGRWYENRLLVEQRAEAVGELSARGSALSSAVNRRLARLQGLHAFVRAEGTEPEFAEKFNHFASDLYTGSRGIRNLAVAPDNTVRYVYPLEGNESVLGYQPMADPRPEVVADVRQAIDTEQIIVSGPLQLVQGGLGIIARQAVYLDEEYWGLVNVVVDVAPLVAEAGLGNNADQLDYALRDQLGRVFYGPASVFNSNPIITQIVLPEGYWELAVVPREGWSALIRQPLFIAWAGSLVTIVVFTGLVYVIANRQRHLAEAIEQRTQQLSTVNTELERRVDERTLELTMLLNISRSVASTLDLQDVFDQVLTKLRSVVDYTGSSILTLADNEFTIRAYQGPLSYEATLGHRYSFDEIIGRQIVEEKTPVLIGNALDDSPTSVAFRQISAMEPHQGRYIKSWMGVPLIAREKVIGILALHHRKPDAYTQADAELTMAFANHVAGAIENARLHDKTQRLAVLQERQRLARELHDSVSQALYGIALGTRTALRLVDRTPMADESREQLNEPLDYVLSLSEGGLAEMRALIFELRPESLENEGLVVALNKQLTALQTRHHIQVKISLTEEPDVALSTKEALYRVAQEALHNIVKHAGATKIALCLTAEDGQLALEIEDNGRGFDVNGDFSGHLGLKSMRERVEQAGGHLTINSSSCHGTQIVAAVPF